MITFEFSMFLFPCIALDETAPFQRCTHLQFHSAKVIQKSLNSVFLHPSIKFSINNTMKHNKIFHRIN